jgi:DMSO/TMAO reductase YedYZ molybdopterin-dependent catalytic subunit
MSSHSSHLSRRQLLGTGLAAALAFASRRLWSQGPAAGVGPESPAGGLVIRNARALDAEAPLSALAEFLTPAEHFFVRSHFGPPDALPPGWTLTIDGAVRTPLTLTLDDIRKLGATTQPVTIECAGNGRGRFVLPNTSGVQWQLGAVSTAEWTGVRLAALLERAGLTGDARHLWMEGLDHAPLPAVPKFLRSVPRELGVADGLVVYEMNGRPIPLLHGGPLRLITPGWFGMASTKWLTHVHARPAVSDNYFMARGYRYADGSPVERLMVKSLITSPVEGARVPVGRLRVAGQAWSGTGSGGIRSVEVSADGGHGWLAARLVGREHPAAWRSWEADVELRQVGPQRVMARATDRSGATQPVTAVANPGGYGNNSIHEVRVDAIRG